MTNKHTKGPWIIDAQTVDKAIAIRGAGDNDGWNYLYAEVQDDDCDPETAKANAHLIAAAPELLEAAQSLETAELHRMNCDECEGDDVPELCATCFPLFDDARLRRRAAIAKATGAA